MSLLEELQKGAEETKQLFEENIKNVLQTVVNESALDATEEESLKEDEQLEESESDFITEEDTDDDIADGDDTEEETDDSEEVGMEDDDVETDGEELPDVETEVEPETETIPEVDSDLPIPSVDEPELPFEDTQDDVLDMTQNSAEEVIEKLKTLPDDTEVVVVKQSSFSVTPNNVEGGISDAPMIGAEPDAELGIDAEPSVGDEFEDESTESPISKDDPEFSDEDETGVSMSGVDTDMGTEEDDDEDDNMFGESLEETVITQRNLIMEYEAKFLKQTNALKKVIVENKALKKKEVDAQKTLSEAKSAFEKLALVNTNLMYTSKLFLENNSSKEEKAEILNDFQNSCTTLNESKIVYSKWKKVLEATSKRKPEYLKENAGDFKKTVLTEDVEAKKTTESKVINESVSYEAKQADRVAQMFNYRS